MRSNWASDKRSNRGLTGSLLGDHESEHNLLNAGVLAASSDELALHRLPVSTGATAGADADALQGALEDDDNRRLYGLELSKRLRSQGIHQAVQDLAAEAEADIDPTLTVEVSTRSRSTSKRRKSSVSSVLKQIGKASKKRSSKRKEAAAAADGAGGGSSQLTPKLKEKKGDTAKGSQRGRSSRSSFFARRDKDDEDDVELWGSGNIYDTSFDGIDHTNVTITGSREKKKKVRSSSAGIVGRMRMRRQTMAERKHGGKKGRRGSLSPLRARQPSSRKQHSAALQDALVMSKSSSGTSGDDNATAVVNNKGAGLGSSHLTSIVVEAQAAREKLAKAQAMERRLERESSEFFADRSERTKSTLMTDPSERTRSTIPDRSERTRSTIHTDRSERTRSTHTLNNSFSDLRQHNSLVVEVPTMQINRLSDRVHSASQLSTSDHFANSYSDLASASVRVARTLTRHSHQGDSVTNQQQSLDEKGALHSSDSQFEYSPSPTPTRGLRALSRERNNKPTKVGMDAESGIVARKRGIKGERTTAAAQTSTTATSIKKSPRLARRTKGISASDRTDSVRTRSTLVADSRQRASALAAAVSSSAHVRTIPPETTAKKAESLTKSMRETRSTGRRTDGPQFSINGAVLPRSHDHALQSLKARGMSASERVHSSRRETFSRTKGMGGSGRMNDTISRHKKMVVPSALEKPRLVASKSADGYTRQTSWRRGAGAPIEREGALRSTDTTGTAEHSIRKNRNAGTTQEGKHSIRKNVDAAVTTPAGKKKKKRLSVKGGKSTENDFTKRNSIPPTNSAGRKVRSTSIHGGKKTRESSSKSRHSRRSRRPVDDARDEKRNQSEHQYRNEGVSQERSRSSHPRNLQPHTEEGGKASSKGLMHRPTSVPPACRLAGVNSKTPVDDEVMPALINMDKVDLASVDPAQILSILATQETQVVPDNVKYRNETQDTQTKSTHKSRHTRSTSAKLPHGATSLESASERPMHGSVDDDIKFGKDFFSEHNRTSLSSWSDAADEEDEFGLL